VPSLIDAMQQEIDNKELGYEVAIRANLLRLYLWILRHRNHNDPSVIKEDDFIWYKRLIPVFQHIHEKYNEDISTSFMADMVNMSMSHFCHLFKKATGDSFHIYLQKFRVTEAIKLLLSTDYNITQITSFVGYNDVNFFIRAFKKQVGLPPLQYRNMYKKQTSAILQQTR
jgi:YesN/AraC family two-component response regulator